MFRLINSAYGSPWGFGNSTPSEFYLYQPFQRNILVLAPPDVYAAWHMEYADGYVHFHTIGYIHKKQGVYCQ